MTDLTPLSPHLDDEALVALLDDEAVETDRREGAAHLDECEACRSRSDQLAGASALVATPVEPLGEDVGNEMVLRALAAASADGEPPAGPKTGVAPVVALQPRRKTRLGPGFRVAATVAVVAGIAGGALVAARHHGGVAGTSSSPNGLSPINSKSPALPSLDLQLRPLISGASASCASVSAPDPGKGVSLPDAIYSSSDRQACLAMGPSLGTLLTPTMTTISGPTGLSGPDTLTVHFPAAASKDLVTVHTHDTKSGPGAVTSGGQRVVAIADGAVVGIVASVTSASDGSEVVVIDQISPAVAEYLDSLLAA